MADNPLQSFVEALVERANEARPSLGLDDATLARVQQRLPFVHEAEALGKTLGEVGAGIGRLGQGDLGGGALGVLGGVGHTLSFPTELVGGAVNQAVAHPGQGYNPTEAVRQFNEEVPLPLQLAALLAQPVNPGSVTKAGVASTAAADALNSSRALRLLSGVKGQAQVGTQFVQGELSKALGLAPTNLISIAETTIGRLFALPVDVSFGLAKAGLTKTGVLSPSFAARVRQVFDRGQQDTQGFERLLNDAGVGMSNDDYWKLRAQATKKVAANATAEQKAAQVAALQKLGAVNAKIIDFVYAPSKPIALENDATRLARPALPPADTAGKVAAGFPVSLSGGASLRKLSPSSPVSEAQVLEPPVSSQVEQAVNASPIRKLSPAEAQAKYPDIYDEQTLQAWLDRGETVTSKGPTAQQIQDIRAANAQAPTPPPSFPSAAPSPSGRGQVTSQGKVPFQGIEGALSDALPDVDQNSLKAFNQNRQAALTSLQRDTERAQAAVEAIAQATRAPVTTIDAALKLGQQATQVAPEQVAVLKRIRDTWSADLLDPKVKDAAEDLVKKRMQGVIAKQTPESGLDKALKLRGQPIQRGFTAAILGGVAAANGADPGETVAAAGAGAALGGNTLSKVNNVFRELALMSPRHHVYNLADAAVKSAAEHIRPYITGSELGQKLNAWGQLGQEGQQALAKGLGASFNPRSEGGNAFMRATKVPGDVLESQFSSDQSALHAFDKLSKGLSGKLGDANRHVKNYFEWMGRASAFVQGKEQYLQSALPEFVDKVRAFVGEDAAKVVEAKGGLMTAKDLAEALPKAAQGLTAEAYSQGRAKLLGEWNTLLSQGDKAGEALSNKIHFNYRYTTNLDDFLSQVLLFHVFATRNLVYYPRFLAEHPWTGAIMANWVAQSNKTQTEQHAGSNHLGEVPVPEQLNNLLTAFWGQDAQALTNPMQYVSGAQQWLPVAKSLAKNTPGETPIGQFVEAQDKLGLGVGPFQKLALALTGGLGSSESGDISLVPLQGLTDLANTGLGVAGVGSNPVNLDPLQMGTRALIGAVTGKQPFDFRQYTSDKRVREAIPEAGQLRFPSNTQATPSPEAVQAARASGLKESGSTGLAGYLGLPVAKPLPNAEAEKNAVRGPDPEPIKTPAGTPAPIANRVNAMQRGQQDSQELRAMLSDERANDTLLRLARSVKNPLLFDILDQDGIEVERDDKGSITRLTLDGGDLTPDEARLVITTWMRRAGSGLPLLSGTYKDVSNQSRSIPQSIKTPSPNQQSAGDTQLMNQWLRAGPTQRAQLLADPERRATLARLLGFAPTQ